MAETTPTVIVLGGVNGAGKTTASRSVLAETLGTMTFVNADVIAQGLSGFNPESVAIEAGRIMLKRLHALAAERADFAFETTLSGRYYAGWLRGLREDGYAVHLVYFWLASADVAVLRVAERVRAGGHNVPEATVRQRYQRSVQNFFRLYRPVASTWQVYDNSIYGRPRLIAHGEGTAEVVVDEVIWQRIQEGLKA